MKSLDLETRLKQAATIASPQRSVVDDVMRGISPALPGHARGFHWRYPVLAACAGIAAVVTFIILFAGPSVHLTLADIQAAVKQQQWAHIRYDAGQIKEEWVNFQTGESYATRYDGGAVYINEQANTRLWYWNNAGVIDQDTAIHYAPGQTPEQWTSQTAWDEFVAPFEHAAATTRPAGESAPVISAHDVLNNSPIIRLDIYSADSLGQRFLYAQLWADPNTHLPVRIKTRLQLGEREQTGKEWSTGDYDFPRTGPADLFAIGVPAGTPIEKEVTTAPADVQPILDAINRNHDHFLKNYRAVVLTLGNMRLYPVDALDIIWRDGDSVRQDHHLPPIELQDNPIPPLPIFTSANLVTWASLHEPVEKQLMNSQREYSWSSAEIMKASKPQVQVTRHDSFPLLATHSWPEQIQWPTRYLSPDFHLLQANAETPAGCIGIRAGEGEGSFGSVYYIDPKNDYVCVKQVQWTKRGGKWAKTNERTLSALHRVDNHVVAGAERTHYFPDVAQGVSDNVRNVTIDLVVVQAGDYPPGTFDPASLMNGAKVEGY